jgi:hypothetical protein
MVAATIFMVVTLTTTPSTLTVSEGLDFVRRLLLTFLIGLAVATGVSLLVLPVTSRRNAFEALNSFAGTVDKLFEEQVAFVRDNVKVKDSKVEGDPEQHTSSSQLPLNSSHDNITPALNTLRGLVAKIKTELIYTKIEVAWGKLFPEDFILIHNHISLVFLPLAGLSMLPEIFGSLLRDPPIQPLPRMTDRVAASTTTNTAWDPSWHNLTVALEKRLDSTRKLTMMGLGAAFNLLEISTSDPSRFHKHRVQLDEEQQDTASARQTSSPSEQFYKGLAAYSDRRRNLHKIWPSLITPSSSDRSSATVGKLPGGYEVRERLLVHLAMEHLQNEVLDAVHRLLVFAETKVSTGSMQHNKLIFPAHEIFKLKGLSWLWPHDDSDSSSPSSPIARPWSTMDAEHLPPTDWFERSGHHLRIIPRLLTSPESIFGARVALACLTVALLAYIRQTQEFFSQQRIIWAMVVIVIGMKAESGASTFGYMARIGGTTVSMILSLIVWYIVDAHTAGVLVFLYLANVFEVSTIVQMIPSEIPLITC